MSRLTELQMASGSRSIKSMQRADVTPLWQRTPGRDEQGVACVDFMMLIPRLKKADEFTLQTCMAKIRGSLEPFHENLVYVDLNVQLNLLWVSSRQQPGIISRMVDSIRKSIPEARVVAADFNPQEAVARSSVQKLQDGVRSILRIS